MRVILDKRRCMGSGNCMIAAEEVFTLGEDGIVELVCAPGEELREKVEAAVRACPTATISIVDDDEAETDVPATSGS